MSGGGHRPPSTRRNSPAIDSRRSITPPARRNMNGNAGYAAIVHGSHGRFTSKQSTVHVADSEELCNSRTGTVVYPVNGSDPLMEDSPLDNAMEEGCHANLGAGTVCEQQHATSDLSQGEQDADFINDSMLLDNGNMAEGTSAVPMAKESSPRLQDEDMQNTDLHGPQDAHGNAPAMMQERFSHVADGGTSVIHNDTYDGCKRVSSSSFDNSSAVCIDSGGDKVPIMHENCNQSMGTQGVCHIAHSKQPTGSAIPNVWKKQGVVLLPSLQDLGNPPSHNGVAQLDDEEVKGYVDRFRSALVGRLFGRHFPFHYLNTKLHRRWDGFGSFKLLTLSNDCFICFFEEAAARDSILMAGPWAVAGQVLGLNVWTPSFSPSAMHGFVTPIWVRFPGLPLYCWGRNSLTRIASILGEPIWIDDATAEMSRASYARVCIKADLSKPLVSSVRVLGLDGPFQQRVEYECLANLCFRCGRVGHKDIKCPTHGSTIRKMQAISLGNSSHAADVLPTIVNEPNHSSLGVSVGTSCKDSRIGLEQPVSTSPSNMFNNNTPSALGEAHPQALKDNDDGFGPWMVVQHRRRKPAQPKQPKLMWIPSSRGNKLLPTAVQNLTNEKMQNISSSHLQGSDCSASVLEHHVIENGGPPIQPLSECNAGKVLSSKSPNNDLKESCLQGSDCAACLQEPHVLENGGSPMQSVFEDGNATMVFSSISPKIFDEVPALSLARVNSNRDIKHKIKGSPVKTKQVFYDAGPLIIGSHKKRRPSIQSIGEDASSTAPG